MPQQILTYWLVAQLAGLAGLPLARLLLAGLPERGYAFSKALGLLCAGWVAWLLAMLGLAPFGAPLVVVAAAAVFAAGALAHPAGRPRAVLADLRAGWRQVLGYEAVFALALVYLAVQRGHDWGFVGPNPWGTERPMDYAFFNAIRVSGSFPPHDPWMSGFSINYYYFGYLLMAAVSLVAGQPPAVSYNLSLALTFALAAQGAAGLVVALARLTARRAAGWPAWGAAALAVLLLLFAGNQGGALEVISGTPMVLALDGQDMARVVANGLGARAPVTLSEPFRGSDFDGTTAITPTDQLKDFNWWNPSRALWDSFPAEGGRQRHYAITEFPFFSFWLGDMHPHVMSLPFTLLSMALALAALARPAAHDLRRGRAELAELLGAAVVLGALYVINSWDFPTYLLLFLAALLLRRARAAAEEGRPLAWRAWAEQAAVVSVAAVALYLPFYLTFRSLVGAKEPLVSAPVLGAITRTVGFVYWSKTPLQTLVIIFGLFLAPLLAWAGWAAGGERGRMPGWLVTLIVLAVGLVAGFPLLALLPVAFYAGRAAWLAARGGRAAESFALAGLALGALICFGTEVVYIRDVFENRMNTIFKFYYQVWVIWSVLAAYALWALFAKAPEPAPLAEPNLGAAEGGPEATEAETPEAGGEEEPEEVEAAAEPVPEPLPEPVAPRRPGLALRAITLALFVPLLAGALLYPAVTLGKLLGEGKLVGLNGTTPRERGEDGAAAIAWLRTNAPGGAVILEAVGGEPWYGYDTAGLGVSGVSSSTGLATVLGWASHQNQWRGGDPSAFAQIEPRRLDVVTIYSTPDPAQARALLAKYGVRYIYVGPTERASYPPEGIAKLAQLGAPVFQQGEVTIYQVAS